MSEKNALAVGAVVLGALAIPAIVRGFASTVLPVPVIEAVPE
jgi:hypothetical protein